MLTLLIISLPFAPSSNAQTTYRGFIEGGVGLDYQVEDASTNFSWMLATTHGIQLKNNFLGLGVGLLPGYSYCWSSNGDNITKISVPLYANWRYDFFTSGLTLKPYIGVKAGYYLPVSEFIDSSGFPLYAALDFGFRKRISASTGVSFGIAIQTSNDADNDNYSSYYVLGLNFMAKIAFDF